MIHYDIQEQIIKDSLESLLFLKGVKWCISGGVAVQMHLPIEERRKIEDIDISTLRPLTIKKFEKIIPPVFESLKREGYSVESNYWDGHLINVLVKKDEKETEIQFKRFRRTPPWIEAQYFIVTQEVLGAKRKLIKDYKKHFNISRPETLIGDKYDRIIKIKQEYKIELEKLSIEKRKNKIKQLEKDILVMEDLGRDPLGTEKWCMLKIEKDLLDVHQLYNFYNIDKDVLEGYFKFICGYKGFLDHIDKDIKEAFSNN